MSTQHWSVPSRAGVRRPVPGRVRRSTPFHEAGRRYRLLRATLWMCALVALPACGAGDRADAGWAGTVDTLDGGAVLVSNPADGIWEDGDAWRVEEDLRIGALEGDGPEVFGQIRDVTADRLGRLYVADAQAQEIRVFDSDGAFIRSIGRPGEGPGEFGSIDALLWGPDGRLWAVDQSNARYSVFDTTGTFRTSHRRRINAFVRPWPGAIDREGRIHDVVIGATTTSVVRFDADFSSADTLALPEFDQDRYQIPIAGGMMSMSLPFAPSLVSRLDSDGRLWWGTSDRYRVRQVGFAGDTLRIIEREWEPAPVSAEEHEDALERFESAADEIESRIPSVKPAFDKIHVDDRDHVWIIPRVEGEEPGRYADIFDPDGRYLGRLTLPLRLPSSPVRFRDGHLYTVVEGELDVPYVVRLRIVRTR